MGIISQRFRGILFWISIPLHGLLYLPYNFAISRWPGGDDGPGMAWLLFVGGGAIIAGVIASVIVIIEIIRKTRRKQTEPVN